MKNIRVGISFKDFASWTGISHIGLCVAALTNARVLSQHGIHTAVFPVKHNVDLVNAIYEYNDEHEHPLTHVIISAPWMSKMDMVSLIEGFPNINFVIESHSNVGFLQADPQGVALLRETLKLSEIYPNIKVGGNSHKFVDWMKLVYGDDVVYLPNLYPICSDRLEPRHKAGPLRIGLFGAIRPLKNFMTAAAAALAIHAEMRVPVELHMSASGEGNGGDVKRAIDQMVKDVPGFKLITHVWRPWQEFIKVVAEMDLLLQPSYTESFNMITADGISVGVPSVVSEAITWAPDYWKADSDTALDIAAVGIDLLVRPDVIDDGVEALRRQNRMGVENWKKYLLGKD